MATQGSVFWVKCKGTNKKRVHTGNQCPVRSGSRIFVRRGCTSKEWRHYLGFFLGGGAPLRNDVTDRWGKQILKANTKKKASSQGGVRTPCTLPLDPPLPVQCPSTRSRPCTRARATFPNSGIMGTWKKGVFTSVPIKNRSRAQCSSTKSERSLSDFKRLVVILKINPQKYNWPQTGVLM